MLQKRKIIYAHIRKPAIQISSTILGAENKSRYLNGGLATHGKLKEATSMASNDLTLFFFLLYICINYGATSSPVSLVK